MRRLFHVSKIFILLFVSFFLSSLSLAICQTKREAWQPPEKIMNAIGVKRGMVIGEAGAGDGFFTFYLAKRVGAEGMIYANDIDNHSLARLKSRAEREAVENIKVILGDVEDPLFPQSDLDMILMVYVLHHLEKPLKFLRNLEKYLKPDAPLVIIERNTDRDRGHYPSFMSKKQILNSVKQTNFTIKRTERFLSKDTIYIYKLKE